MATAAPAPSLDIDLYAEDILEDSREVYAQIRNAGPVVRLPRNKLWAMGRFEDVRAALRDDESFISGEGVAANGFTNLVARKTTLMSDGETHVRRRKVLMRSLGAKALASVEEQVDAEAEEIVEALLDGREFDAAADFASGLPVRVVAELVGVKVDSDQMLKWAASSFESLGPLNRRGFSATVPGVGLLMYSARLNRKRVAEGSWAASVFDAADAGEITMAEARTMVIDFVAPSLDTTILAATYMLWLLGRNPDTWDRIRANPDLVSAAVVEAVRIASPIRGFTRRVAKGTELGGVTMKRGERVVLLFAAADLDERQFPDPERFDLDRSPGAHVGWGNGPHTCVGIHLAKLELRARLRAMIPRVERVTVGEPKWMRNNTLQGISELPARFERA